MKRAFALLAVLFMLAVPSVAVAENGRPCSLGCGATFSVAAAGVTRWESPQRFTAKDSIQMELIVNGYRLNLADGGTCSSWAYGRGVMVAIQTCGKRRLQPIRLTVVRLRRGVTVVHVSYKLLG